MKWASLIPSILLSMTMKMEKERQLVSNKSLINHLLQQLINNKYIIINQSIRELIEWLIFYILIMMKKVREGNGQNVSLLNKWRSSSKVFIRLDLKSKLSSTIFSIVTHIIYIFSFPICVPSD